MSQASGSNNQITPQSLHRAAHRNNQQLLTSDETCARCYPPIDPTTAFLNFWNLYIEHFVPTAEEYSEITIQRFKQYHQIIEDIVNRGYITVSTAPVLRYIQRVINIIYHRRRLTESTTDLAVKITLIAILTEGFE